MDGCETTEARVMSGVPQGTVLGPLMFAFKTRELKKQRKIQDCWTHSGRILVKDNDNNIYEISSDIDLKRFTNV